MAASFSDFLPFLVIGGVALIAAIHHTWEFRILPHRIPPEDIRRLVDELIARHGDRAEEVAYINEDRAWRYSDTREQGKWRRVRDELRRRSAQGGG